LLSLISVVILSGAKNLSVAAENRREILRFAQNDSVPENELL
jgi:hypothetical protein